MSNDPQEEEEDDYGDYDIDEDYDDRWTRSDDDYETK